jgi:hypothetical protein
MTEMRRPFARAIYLALLVTLAGCKSGDGQVDAQAVASVPGRQIDVAYFHQSLAPYGEWFESDSYGRCWSPRDMSADWRPYSDGHWEYTDYGWSWASEEPWGWAPYHYGRWFFDDSYGWAWAPGTEWAPAWVAWRYDEGWVGWAPLPPTARWTASNGLHFAGAGSIPSRGWCFVPRQNVFDRDLRPRVTSVGRNVTFIERTRDATRFGVHRGRPANIGIAVGEIEHTTGRRVPRAQVVDIEAPGNGGGRAVGKDRVGFFRPAVRQDPVRRVTAQAVSRSRRDAPIEIPQQQREERQRRLENDLGAEQARLGREQQDERREQRPGPRAEGVRRQQAAEQQAFQNHAAEQRRVISERPPRQAPRPENVAPPAPRQVAKPDNAARREPEGKRESPKKDRERERKDR